VIKGFKYLTAKNVENQSNLMKKSLINGVDGFWYNIPLSDLKSGLAAMKDQYTYQS
jgi:hypothetical protein